MPSTVSFTLVQLLRERMRSFDSGITSFDLHKEYVESSSGFVLCGRRLLGWCS
jgi:hypothetical protein